MSVCPLAYLRNHTAELYQILMRVAVARTSSSGGAALRCVLPGLWMTSCIHSVGLVHAIISDEIDRDRSDVDGVQYQQISNLKLAGRCLSLHDSSWLIRWNDQTTYDPK